MVWFVQHVQFPSTLSPTPLPSPVTERNPSIVIFFFPLSHYVTDSSDRSTIALLRHPIVDDMFVSLLASDAGGLLVGGDSSVTRYERSWIVSLARGCVPLASPAVLDGPETRSLELDEPFRIEYLRYLVVRACRDPVAEQRADHHQAQHQQHQASTVVHPRTAARLFRLQLRCKNEQRGGKKKKKKKNKREKLSYLEYSSSNVNPACRRRKGRFDFQRNVYFARRGWARFLFSFLPFPVVARNRGIKRILHASRHHDAHVRVHAQVCTHTCARLRAQTCRGGIDPLCQSGQFSTPAPSFTLLVRSFRSWVPRSKPLPPFSSTHLHRLFFSIVFFLRGATTDQTLPLPPLPSIIPLSASTRFFFFFFLLLFSPPIECSKPNANSSGEKERERERGREDEHPKRIIPTSVRSI